ncbi:MAG: CoA transferase [Acetobacterales bacterium]
MSGFAPLAGIRVVDCSHILAGPYGTYLLALLGAEVIKVEPPGVGDWTRGRGLSAELAAQKMGVSFLTQNAQKRSVEIDLKSPDGRERLLALVAGAQVFVENFRPGKAAKLGLGWDELRAINPRLVYCSISGYGQTGDFAPRGAYDHVVQAVSGMMSMVGTKESGPTKIGFPAVDYAAGLYAALGIMAALRDAEATGRGHYVDVAMMDAAMMLMAPVFAAIPNAGWEPQPMGNAPWSRAPSAGVFDTADGRLSLAANTVGQFEGLCRGLGRADILEDPRWSTLEARAENGDALRAEIGCVLMQDTALAWEGRLSAEGVPCGKVRKPDEVLAEPHVAARELFATLAHARIGRPVTYPTAGFRVDGAAVAPTRGAPCLGEDNDWLDSTIS